MTLYAPRLESAVGAAHVTVEGERVTVRPGSAAEAAGVLRVAREAGAPAAIGARAGIALDFSRMRNVLHLDETSLLVGVQAGLTARELDEILAPRGLELAPLPSWSRDRTIGALLAAPRPSEASPRAGRFTAGCAGVAALLADGSEISTRVAPRKAVGPDLMHALVGARGTTGLITAATLRVSRRGEAREAAAWEFPDGAPALASARALLAGGGRPLDMRVGPGPIWALISDGPAGMAAVERDWAGAIAGARGGRPIPHTPPPPVAEAPHERSVPLDHLDSLIHALRGGATRVIGFSTLGCALVDPARRPEPPHAPPALATLLKERLDPDARWPPWPGSPNG